MPALDELLAPDNRITQDNAALAIVIDEDNLRVLAHTGAFFHAAIAIDHIRPDDAVRLGLPDIPACRGSTCSRDRRSGDRRWPKARSTSCTTSLSIMA